eukprot:TRINITY_DN91108_c0_g1_i1.p1 TRINITY_DN91108_c0_g1~~TRINITY_DN91108_c0_g1_i1.p1  ORF type:complete len:373 (+),score=61.22 TRINITY_DN91108_c0_g1_i1:48-1121(+)
MGARSRAHRIVFGCCIFAFLRVALMPALSAFLGRGRRQPSSGAIEALLEDVEAAAPGKPGSEARLVLSALLEGIHDAGFLGAASYDPKKRRAKFKVKGGGAVGTLQPEHRIWLQLLLGQNLRVWWERGKDGRIIAHFSGLSLEPLPGAQELYMRSGLDDWTCPGIKAVSQQEYYECHLEKAMLLEEFWKKNRTLIPKNLQHQFSFIGDNAIISQLSEQLGHGFGWSMLLVLCAPPSTVDTLEFTDIGVMGTSNLDKSQAASKLSKKHGFKDLSLNIARPLVGDTRFGSVVRTVGEKFLRLATNFGILCSVGEPRWRSRGFRGADAQATAEIFGLYRPSMGRSGAVGALTWQPRRRHH